MLHLRRLAITPIVLCLCAAPALAGPSGTFKGHTSDQRHVAFRVSGGQVHAFAFQTRFRCSNRTGFVASATFPSIRLRGNHFHGVFHNVSGSLRTTINGSIHGRRASGTIQRRATFNNSRILDPRGHLICTASTRFTAKR